MPSETDCLNDALSQVGAAPISAIDDGSTNANYCLTFYPSLRDGLLRSHRWNFAETRQELAQEVTPPVTEYTYRYALPNDPYCLKVHEYAGGNPVAVVAWPFEQQLLPRYKIEGRFLVSNDGQAFIVFTGRIENPDLWDATFYQLMTTWLASKLATAIHHDQKMSAALLTNATTILLPLATAVDGQEGSQEPFIVNNLLWGRNRV
jgi:hypothetical protein